MAAAVDPAAAGLNQKGFAVRSLLSRSQGFLFILPALLFVGIFVFWPLAQLVMLSLTDTSLLGGGKFIGLDNYIRLLHDPIGENDELPTYSQAVKLPGHNPLYGDGGHS